MCTWLTPVVFRSFLSTTKYRHVKYSFPGDPGVKELRVKDLKLQDLTICPGLPVFRTSLILVLSALDGLLKGGLSRGAGTGK